MLYMTGNLSLQSGPIGAVNGLGDRPTAALSEPNDGFLADCAAPA